MPVADAFAGTDVTTVDETDALGAQGVGLGHAEQAGRQLGIEEVGGADETGDERRGRSVVDLLGCAHLFDAAFVEHRDPGAHRQRLALVVGDEHERDADGVLDRLELDLHLLAELEVERAERLVEQQHSGLVDQRPGERDALTLPAAQLVRATFAELAEADDVEHLTGATTTLGPTDTFHLEPVLDVLADGHVGEQRVVLEHRVDVAVVGGDVGDVLAGEQDRPRRRLLEPGDHPQHRRLAGAGRAEQREELAGSDRQRDTVDGHDVAELLADPHQLDRVLPCRDLTLDCRHALGSPQRHLWSLSRQ